MVSKNNETKDKLSWCLKKPNGIELVEPNENLSKKYFNESDSTLLSLEAIKKTKWGAIMAYYACYNSLYAILQKAGIKCEIHSCTIELMKYLSLFTKEEIEFIQDLKEIRQKNQYYLENIIIKDLNSVKSFIIKCKQVAEKADLGKFRDLIKDGKK